MIMPASFMFLLMPNSAADLMAFTVSPPALARASTCAFELCACSMNDEKSLAPSGCFTEPATVPPLACTVLVASPCSAAPKA
ncbi:hypothetical protein D9M70_639950 [compost metagenome]